MYQFSPALWQFCGIAACVIATVVSGKSIAQADFPTKPIRLVVPFAPGGSTDVIARLLSEKLSVSFGRQVVIDNRPGGGAIIGADYVAKSAPDGHTLVVSSTSSIAPVPLMRASMPYDPLRDFSHIALIGTFANGVLVRGDSPYRTLRELLDQIRAQPGKLTYASVGIGSSGYMTGELLKQRAGVDIVHVPYKGASQAVIDLIAGRVDIQFESLVSAIPNLRAGKLRLLAVASPGRSKAYPDIPAIAEQVPGVVGAPWFGISAPAKIPAAILARLERDIVGVLRHADTRTKLSEMGMEPSEGGPAEFLAHIQLENQTWAPIIRALNIRIE
jgi:tripartite-type tricarboxylate transporter receptor subunit TctC